MLIEKISSDVEVFTTKWLMDAAKEASERGKINNYKYITGILQNWKSNGRKEKKLKESKQNATAYEPMKSILDE